MLMYATIGIPNHRMKRQQLIYLAILSIGRTGVRPTGYRCSIDLVSRIQVILLGRIADIGGIGLREQASCGVDRRCREDKQN